MKRILAYAQKVFALESYEIAPVSEHEGGRNIVYLCSTDAGNKKVLRISLLNDRDEHSYLAEAEFIHYLAQHGAPVADVHPSVNGKYVECCVCDDKKAFICLFDYAKGILLVDNGYRYRDGVPIEEYFFNTGKTLGVIHRLSKSFVPRYQRPHYFEKYNMEYINQLIPDEYAMLKNAIAARLEAFRALPVEKDDYGLVHFDFSDGNYHIDMENGQLTVFDFDNCMNCWFMFDLANLWTHGVGWCQFITDAAKRMAYMEHYFSVILEGYRSETDVSPALLEKLPLFIDMVLIENIVDEFECCARENEEIDDEDIEDAANCLIGNIPYAGVGEA